MPRGGKREGAGRPVTKNPKKTYVIRLRQDLIAWLKDQKNAAREIEMALDTHIAKVTGNE